MEMLLQLNWTRQPDHPPSVIPASVIVSVQQPIIKLYLQFYQAVNAPETHVERELSPAQLRKRTLLLPAGATYTRPRSYAVEAVCAIAHPTPTHALAHSLCMTHLLTGSDDGYIRDYDIFAAVNGKAFLTAPQRHHCGVVEGIMKAGQIRYWWENPKLGGNPPGSEENSIAPVYSLLLQSDALWSLAGSNVR